jgi:hypothetical protein
MNRKFLTFVLLLIFVGSNYAQTISTFPWTEGFEGTASAGGSGTTQRFQLPEGWVNDRNSSFPWPFWDIVGVDYNTPNSPPHTTNSGNRKAFFSYTGGNNATSRLITPALDLTGLSNPMLSFYRAQARYPGSTTVDRLRVSYRTSATGAWTLIQEITTRAEDWTEERFELPNPSATYYIQFEAVSNGGSGVQLDDVSVFNFSANFIDAELLQIITPIAGTNFGLSNAEPVRVVIRNNGVAPISNFDVKLTLGTTEIVKETFTGTINAGDTASYTFSQTLNLFADATYSVMATVLLAGDMMPDNDSRTITVVNVVCSAISTFPWTEGFESTTFPPLCWSMHNRGNRWERRTGTPQQDWGDVNSGTGAARYNFGSGNNTGWLITRKIAVPSDGKAYALDFWTKHGFPEYETYNGILISTTTNDTAAFTEVKRLEGENEFTDRWKRIRISLVPYAGQEIYVAFKYEGGFGNTWYLDDITVSDVSGEIDLEAARIVEPNSGINLSATEEVKVLLKNNGGATLSNFQLQLFHNSLISPVATEIFSGTLAPLSDSVYTFTRTLDLTADGNHRIRVVATATGDQNRRNDTITKWVTNTSCPLITNFPWKEDFTERSFACWRNIDADGDGERWNRRMWEISEEDVAGFMVSFSAWFLADAGQWFGLNPDNWLISPQIKLEDAGDYVLSFLAGSMDETGTRYAENYTVYLSTTGFEIDDFTEILYTERLTEVGLQEKVIPLNDYLGESIYIAIRHHDSPNQYVLVMQDFMIRNLQGFVDGEILEILSPKSCEECLTANESVEVWLKNNGGDPITGFTMQLKVDGTVVATEIFTDVIPSLGEYDYTFAHKVDLSSMVRGSEITATIIVPGDMNPNNNSRTIKVANFSKEVVELFAYRIDGGMGSPAHGFVYFNSNTPGTVTRINNFLPNIGSDANTIFGGTYFDGSLYFYSAYEDEWVGGYETRDFVQLDADNFEVIESNPVTFRALDLSYDYTTKKMFGVHPYRDENGPNSALVVINLETGELTESDIVGELGQYFYGMAISTKGQMFGIGIDGGFYSIDKTTAQTTYISHTGLVPWGLQSMAFDHETGRLFWAALTEGGRHGRLFEIQTTTGVMFDRGQLGANSQMVMLYTPFDGEIDASIRLKTPQNNPLKAWMQHDVLNILGLNIGERFAVYNVFGMPIYQGIANNEIETVTLHQRGTFIIRSGNHAVKIVY